MDFTQENIKEKNRILKSLEALHNPDEVWVKLYEYEHYQISNYGRLKSIGRKISIGIRNGVEYFRDKDDTILVLRTNGIEKFLFTGVFFRDEKDNKCQKTIYVHRAVADHFVKKPKRIIDYEKNGGHICATLIVKDYTNNSYKNIKWITQAELIQTQPNRLANPTKAWGTRRVIYGSTGSNADAKTGKVPRKPRTKKVK